MGNDSYTSSRTRFLAWTWCAIFGLGLGIGDFGTSNMQIALLLTFVSSALAAHLIHRNATFFILAGVLAGFWATKFAVAHAAITQNMVKSAGVGLVILTLLMRPAWLRDGFRQRDVQ